MIDPTVVVTAFAITFIAELPDKSLLAALVLGTRYRPRYVWVGVSAAFAVHVALAVVAGGFLKLLPHRVLEILVAGLFFVGAAWILFAGRYETETGADESRQGGPAASFWRVAATGFLVVFIGEWGDVTQLTTANLAARYDPVSVGVGAVLALCAVAGLAVTAGVKVLDRVPARPLRLVTASILGALGTYSLISGLLPS
ncbi:MAG TPA: TMEM165/GDT1 family protein [Mycobacteriales bacterium]|nr:TMEM165/GDT1 family protein [Mycobacteriales bacterium]